MSTDQDTMNNADQNPFVSDNKQPLSDANNSMLDKNRSNSARTSDRLLLVFCALVVIIGGICLSAFFTYQNIQKNNALATATAQAHATGTVLGDRATATEFAKATATAASDIMATASGQFSETVTAIATSPHNPYPPNTGYLAVNEQFFLYDSNFPNSDKCSYFNHSYRISVDTNHVQFCPMERFFSNFAMEVTMTIEQGDCGGLQFRADINNNKFYFFQVCADDSFNVYISHGPDNNNYSNLKFGASDAIHFGHDQSNLIAVVANGSQLDFYVNHQLVDHENDSSFTDGYTGLLATAYNDATEVTYTDEHIWKL